MTETRCRWDRDQGQYLTPDDEACDTPRNQHCGAKRGCSNHLGWGELTCARCLGDTRRNIRRIVDLAALMPYEAEITGVNSEAANLAGPAADVEAWSWRKVAAMQGRAWHLSVDEEDDDWHPFTVLTRWAWMLAGAYKLPEPNVYTISNAAYILDKQLHRIAQDPEQDFVQMAGEIRRCRSHMEAVLATRAFTERGVPCPTCKDDDKFVRLRREFPHWCKDPDCTQQFHFITDEADVWVCPRDREHWWTAGGYAEYLEQRMGA